MSKRLVEVLGELSTVVRQVMARRVGGSQRDRKLEQTKKLFLGEKKQFNESH